MAQGIKSVVSSSKGHFEGHYHGRFFGVIFFNKLLKSSMVVNMHRESLCSGLTAEEKDQEMDIGIDKKGSRVYLYFVQ